MKRWDTVAIVGVGLIGGSIGLALRGRRLAGRVVGIGRTAGPLRVAKRAGAIDASTTDLARGVADASLVVVCTPVAMIAEHVLAVAGSAPRGVLITDAGSTKGNIVAALDGRGPVPLRFVGSHPLAGSEKRGPAAAQAELFVGRTVVVTPTPETPAADTRETTALWRALGAEVVRMTPDEHDRAVAAISHLPHLVASALAAVTTKSDLKLAASGWCDTTRIAAGDVELWTQIFLANRDHVLAALDRFDETTAKLRAALAAGQRTALYEILTLAKKNRDAVGS